MCDDVTPGAPHQCGHKSWVYSMQRTGPRKREARNKAKESSQYGITTTTVQAHGDPRAVSPELYPTPTLPFHYPTLPVYPCYPSFSPDKKSAWRPQRSAKITAISVASTMITPAQETMPSDKPSKQCLTGAQRNSLCTK